MSTTPRYWAFRADKRYLKQLHSELQQGRLRQGWGWLPEQNLELLERKDKSFIDRGARRNRRMLEVRKDDMILIPHLTGLGQVTIAKATADWKDGYRFKVLDETEDHGHIFPAEIVKSFHRRHEHVHGDLRGTFRNPSRFWNVDYLHDALAVVLECNTDMDAASEPVARWETGILASVEESGLRQRIVDRTHQLTTKSEWEHVLADALKVLHPDWDVQTTSNRKEAEHGTDILVLIPRPGGGDYGVAIQVKDYFGDVSHGAIDQVRKAIGGYKDDGLQIIELILIVTGTTSDNNDVNKNLEAYAKGDPDTGPDAFPVRILWKEHVDQLIYDAAVLKIGLNSDLE